MLRWTAKVGSSPTCTTNYHRTALGSASLRTLLGRLSWAETTIRNLGRLRKRNGTAFSVHAATASSESGRTGNWGERKMTTEGGGGGEKRSEEGGEIQTSPIWTRFKTLQWQWPNPTTSFPTSCDRSMPLPVSVSHFLSRKIGTFCVLSSQSAAFSPKKVTISVGDTGECRRQTNP